jgi:hypothetical protein
MCVYPIVAMEVPLRLVGSVVLGHMGDGALGGIGAEGAGDAFRGAGGGLAERASMTFS